MVAAVVLLLAGYAAMAYFNNNLIIPAIITGVILIVYFVIMAFVSGKAKFVLIQVFVYGEIVVMLLAGIFTVSSRPMGDYGRYILLRHEQLMLLFGDHMQVQYVYIIPRNV